MIGHNDTLLIHFSDLLVDLRWQIEILVSLILINDVDICNSLIHFLQLVAISSLLIHRFIHVCNVMPRCCWYRMMCPHLLSPRNWNGISQITFSFVLCNLQVCIRVKHLELREFTEWFLLDVFLLDQKMIMWCEVILHIRHDATLCILCINVFTGCLHFFQKLSVHMNVVIAVQIAFINGKGWSIDFHPSVLLDLLQAIAKFGFRHQDLLD